MHTVKIFNSIAILSVVLAVAACDPPGVHKIITFKPDKSLEVITQPKGQMIVNVNDDTSGANWVDCVPNTDEGCRRTFLIEDAKPPPKNPFYDDGDKDEGGNSSHHP